MHAITFRGKCYRPPVSAPHRTPGFGPETPNSDEILASNTLQTRLIFDYSGAMIKKI
jgi:hypothetical protein